MARTIRPGPVRTGREPDDRLREDVLLRFDEVRRVWLPDDRDRELLPLDLLEPRDLGGEDVRVAMIARLCRYHTSLTRHTPIFRPVSPIRPRRDGCTESSRPWRARDASGHRMPAEGPPPSRTRGAIPAFRAPDHGYGREAGAKRAYRASAVR